MPPIPSLFIAMHEIELKFQIPQARRPALRRTVAVRGSVRTRLKAQYHDTPDRLLARHGFALRLRLEGDRWVQTLKGGGDGLMQRLEHNAEVASPQEGDPCVDPGRHDGSPAGRALRALLDGAGASASDLVLQYRTDILRTHRVLRHGAARIELALDEGEITGGRDGRVEVHEIELELVEGPPAALLDLASQWVRRDGLWLDVRTKAERGDRLAREMTGGLPVQARPLALERSMSPPQARVAMLRNVLQHVLPNASELGGGSGTPEHLHQLRVGLRRLRAVLRELGPFDGGQAVEEEAAALFGALGAARDWDVLSTQWAPRLLRAGAPALRPVEDGFQDVGQRVCAESTQLLWLAALRLTLSDGGGSEETPDVALRPWVRQRLWRLHRRLVEDAGRFERLDLAEQHRVRKRIKRLRYVFELTQSLHPRKSVPPYLAALQRAQDALGVFNDLCVAEAAYQAQAETEPQAWLAVGWLRAHGERAVRRSARALRALARTPVGWERT